MDNKKILQEYASYQMQISELESKVALLKPEVTKAIAEIQNGSDQPVGLSELPGYTFSVGSRKKWYYPDRIIQMQGHLKTMEKKAQQDGEATFEDGEPYPIFKSPKE